jgi:hypothetical protein
VSSQVAEDVCCWLPRRRTTKCTPPERFDSVCQFI